MRNLLISFVAGANLVPVAVFLQRSLQSILLSPLLLALYWASIEELLKIGAIFVVIFIFAVPKSQWIKLAIAVSLGFALTENILYYIAEFNVGGDSSLYKVIFTRFVLANPLHLIATCLAVFGFKRNFYTGIVMLILSISFHNFFNTFVAKGFPEWFTYSYAFFLIIVVPGYVIYKMFKFIFNKFKEATSSSNSLGTGTSIE